eukprot:scaffold264_cov317-Pinguiococcus_pyrenoidosus.AAC.39
MSPTCTRRTGVLAAIELEGLQRLHGEVAEVVPLLLPVVDAVSQVGVVADEDVHDGQDLAVVRHEGLADQARLSVLALVADHEVLQHLEHLDDDGPDSRVERRLERDDELRDDGQHLLALRRLHHVVHALLGQEGVGLLHLPQPVEEDGQVVVVVQLLHVHFPRNAVVDAAMVHLDGQVASLIEAPELGIGRVGPLLEGSEGQPEALGLRWSRQRPSGRLGPQSPAEARVLLQELLALRLRGGLAQAEGRHVNLGRGNGLVASGAQRQGLTEKGRRGEERRGEDESLSATFSYGSTAASSCWLSGAWGDQVQAGEALWRGRSFVESSCLSWLAELLKPARTCPEGKAAKACETEDRRTFSLMTVASKGEPVSECRTGRGLTRISTALMLSHCSPSTLDAACPSGPLAIGRATAGRFSNAAKGAPSFVRDSGFAAAAVYWDERFVPLLQAPGQVTGRVEEFPAAGPVEGDLGPGRGTFASSYYSI